MVCIIASTLLWLEPVLAQEITRGVAENTVVADQEIVGGNILEQRADGIWRTKEAYAQKVFGVALDNPIIVVHEKTDQTRAIASSGEALVLVSAKNGAIKAGDYITSSDIPGVGMKARNPGYVIGIAKTEFAPPNSDSVGTSNENGSVVATINIHFAARAEKDLGNPILRIIKSFTTALEDQSKIALTIRYVIGSLAALLILLASMFLFARGIKSSIEALGRNPLARNSIQFGMLINFALATIGIVVGLFVAFIIIRL